MTKLLASYIYVLYFRNYLGQTYFPNTVKMATAVGSRLLPHLVDNNAEADPDGTFGQILRDNNIPDQWISLSKRQLAKSVDHAAWWFKNTVAKKCDTTTIAYMGPSDIRYMICALALAKAGYKASNPPIIKVMP